MIASTPKLAPLDGWFKKPPSRLYAGQLMPRLVLHAQATSTQTWTLRALLRGPNAPERVQLLREALTLTGTGMGQMRLWWG